MIDTFYPWQCETAQRWLSDRNRFAHAWLIHGLSGIGKTVFALSAAKALLCEAPQQGLACGHCTACRWVQAGTHPDLRRIRPDAVAQSEGDVDEEAETSSAARKNPSRDIRVEQLRNLHDWFNTATHRGGFRVAVLYPAESLNAISANALLKVLEEPPEHTVFLLVSDAPDRLLPTLVSRCRRLPLAVPPANESQAWLADQGLSEPQVWLAASGGAPCRALALSQQSDTACPAWLTTLVQGMAKGQPDIAAAADAIESLPASLWIDALQRWWVDLMLGARQMPVRYFPQLAQATQAVGQCASPAALADTAQWLVQQRALADHPLNAKLLGHAAVQRITVACRPQA